jgi:hypothetical protein
LLRPSSGIESSQQEKFYNKAYPCHDQGSEDRCNIEADDRDEKVLPDGVSDKGPEHINGTMGKIEDPQDTEGERKARGDQKKQGAPGDPTHELVEKNIERHMPYQKERGILE